MSFQKLLKLATLILNRLLHKMRPDVADSKIGHVHLHQVQHRENLSVWPGRTKGRYFSETGLLKKRLILLQNCCNNKTAIVYTVKKIRFIILTKR